MSPIRKEELYHRFLCTVHCTSLNAPICQEDSYIELITLPSLWKSPLVPLTLLSRRKHSPSFSVLHPSSSLTKPSTPSPLYESLPLSLSPYYLVANTPSFSNLLTLPSPCFTPLPLSLNPQHPPLSMKVSPCPSHPTVLSRLKPQSKEVTRGPPELVQHFRL